MNQAEFTDYVFAMAMISAEGGDGSRLKEAESLLEVWNFPVLFLGSGAKLRI